MKTIKTLALIFFVTFGSNVFAQCDFTIMGSPNPGDPLELGFATSKNDGLDYLWKFGDGDSATFKGGTHKYDKSGDYEVCVTIDTCETVCKTFTVGTSSVKDLNQQEFKLYPNPSTDNFSLEFSLNTPQALNLKVVSYTGIVVLEKSISGTSGDNSSTFDISSLTKGMYSIQIVGEENTLQKTLLKL